MRITESVKPRLVIYAVYKTPRNTWRGFCDPFDVTCEEHSQEDALKCIEEMSSLYEDGLKKYGYPKHLSLRALSDKDDKEVLKMILRKISSNMEKELRENHLKFQETKEKERFAFRNPFSSGYYFQPAL